MIMFADLLIISVLKNNNNNKKRLNLLSVGLVFKMYAMDDLSEHTSLPEFVID